MLELLTVFKAPYNVRTLENSVRSAPTGHPLLSIGDPWHAPYEFLLESAILARYRVGACRF